MRKLLFTTLLMLAASMAREAMAQELDSVKALVAREQYLSAFKTLAKVQEISAAGIHLASDILLNHRSDINEYYNKFTLEDKRKDGRGQQMDIDFPLEEFLWRAVEFYPDSCTIYQHILEFYQMPIQYEDKFIELNVLSQVENAVRTKINTKCPGYLSNYIIGYCNNYLGQADYGIGFLQKAIALNKNFAPAYRELSTAYLLAKDPKNALTYANKAFSLSAERWNKGKAALIAGQAYEAMNDNANAIQNYRLADSLHPKDYFIRKAIVNYYVKTGNINEALKATDNFLGPNNRINLAEYIDVFRIYSGYKREKELTGFCEDRLTTYKNRPSVLACLYFTLGKIHQQTNPSLAKQYFTKAKEQEGTDFSRYKNRRNQPNIEEEIKKAFQ